MPDPPFEKVSYRSAMGASAKRVLCLLAPGFEEIETAAPIDLLNRAGAEVVVASVTGESHVTGRSKLTVRADVLLDALGEAQLRAFHLLLLPGGPGYKVLRSDGRARDYALAFVASGRPVAAICGAPTVLHDAGLLADRRYTAHSSVQGELGGRALLEERVVEDRLVITSRGAGTAIDFGLALVRHLYGVTKAEEIAHAIMA